MDQEAEQPATPADGAAKPRRARGRMAADAALARMAQAAASLSAAEASPSSASDPVAEHDVQTPVVGTGLVVAAVPSRERDTPKSAPRPETSGRNLPLFAAALCLALGIGGALGTQIGGGGDATPLPETARLEKALPWKRDVAEAGSRDTGRLRDELRSLRSEVAALRANSEQLRQAESQKQTGEWRTLRGLLESQKSETASMKADVAARFDRADRDAAQRGDKLAERVDRVEKRLADPAPTASIAKPADAPKADKAVHGMVLRDVARGVALIESRRGMMEVVVGDQIPGAGRVEAIEKRAGKWRVVTSTGVIDDVIE